jgi:hypothetical protein
MLMRTALQEQMLLPIATGKIRVEAELHSFSADLQRPRPVDTHVRVHPEKRPAWQGTTAAAAPRLGRASPAPVTHTAEIIHKCRGAEGDRGWWPGHGRGARGP